MNEIFTNFINEQSRRVLQEIESEQNQYKKIKTMYRLTDGKPYLRKVRNNFMFDASYKDNILSSTDTVFKYYYTNSKGKSTPCATVHGTQQFTFSAFLNSFDFSLVFDDKENLSGSTVYKQFINNSKKNQFVVLTNNKVFFEWAKQFGMPIKDKKFFEDYKVKKEKKQVYYSISPGNTTTFRFSSVDTLKRKNGKVYYVPIKGNEIIGNKWDYYWINQLQNYKNIQIYGLRNKQYELYKDDEDFINAIDVYQNIFDELTDEMKQRFSVDSECYMNKVLARMFKKGLVFNESLMSERVKYDYEHYFKQIQKQKGQDYCLTEKEKQLYKVVHRVIPITNFQSLDSYIQNNFPLFYRLMRQYFYQISQVDKYVEEVKLYVETKQKIMLR